MISEKITVVCVDDIDAYESYHSDVLSNGLILTIDIAVTARAKREKRKVLSICDLMNEHSLFSKAKESFDLSKEVSNKLSDAIPKIGFDLTGTILYPIKITLDTILLYSTLIHAVDKKLNPHKIIGINPPSIKYNNYLLLDNSFPLLSYIAKHLSDTNKISATFVSCDYDTAKLQDGAGFSFGQPKLKSIIFGFIPFLRKFHDLIELNILLILCCILISKTKNKNRTLAIGSRDMNSGSFISKYAKFPNLLKINSQFLLKIKDINLTKEMHTQFDVKVADVDVKPFVNKIASIIIFNRKRLQLRYSYISLIIRLFKPNILVAQTGSIFNLLSMFALEASKVHKIKAYCWMHGGYGAYTSLPGFDVTDYYSFSGHLLYGEGAQDSVLSQASILRKLYPNKIFETYILGSPFIEKAHEVKKRNEIAFNRNKIVFVLPGAYNRNSYYIGYDRDLDFLNYQQCILSILQVLVKHSSDYDIIVKDYPNEFFRELVVPDFQSLRYISHEVGFLDCVYDAGAIVLPWVSTSFMESILTNANIILFDPSNMNKTSAQILHSECALFCSNLEDFIHKFDETLVVANELRGFSEVDNSALRSYFVQPTILCDRSYSEIFETGQ